MSTAAADEAAALFSHSGKLTTHPEDARSRTPSEPDSDAELNNNNNDADPTASSDMPAPSLNYHMPHGTSFDANTGPKGVIADARSFERAKKQKWRFLQRSAGSLSPEAEYKQKDLSLAGRDERSLSPQHMDDDDDDDDDDEFMERWRKSRLSELRSGDVRSRRLSPSMRRYGSMVNVDAVGYLDAIEKVGRDTVVVVCIYDDQSEVSQVVEDSLSTLARKHVLTRFVKLHYEEAEMDVASVPAVLAYRTGDLFANLVAVIDEIPPDRTVSSASLETVLKKHRVLE